jgi:hypothetical protein
MTPVAQGLVAGTVFGALTVAAMWGMKFEDRRRAFLGAFTNRFAIGFVIPLVVLHEPGWLVGGGIGLLLSLSAAIITKTHLPILLLGTVGGVVIGGLTHGWN